MSKIEKRKDRDARLYDLWIKEQIDILKNYKFEVTTNADVDLKKDIPFKILVPLKENPREPEYVVQYLFKKNLDKSGLWIETGVWCGQMINRMAHANPDKEIYGFDSFEGFPDDGREPGDWDYKAFNLKGNIPRKINGIEFANNITLIKGWFKDTLPWFLKEKKSHISLISIDCDLYSSTLDVLESIKNYINNDTIIILDDAWHYDGFQNHQIKALYEFIIKYNYTAKWICCRGEMFDFDKLDERRGEGWNWRNQFKWRKNNNYSDCALYLVK